MDGWMMDVLGKFFSMDTSAFANDIKPNVVLSGRCSTEKKWIMGQESAKYTLHSQM